MDPETGHPVTTEVAQEGGIMAVKRKQHTAAFKAQVAWPPSGGQTVNELAGQSESTRL